MAKQHLIVAAFLSILSVASAGAATVSIVGYAGKCLEAGSSASLRNCSAASTAQAWTVTPNGPVKASDGRCLALGSNGSIMLTACAASAASQVWRAVDADGSLRGAGDRCLDSSGFSGLAGRNCNAREEQIWRLSPTGSEQGQWKPQTFFLDRNCTGCVLVQKTQGGPHDIEVSVYEHPQLDDPTTQWSACVKEYIDCATDARRLPPTLCISRAPCAESCRRRYQAAAAGKDLRGAVIEFKRLFIGQGAACRPHEADEGVVP